MRRPLSFCISLLFFVLCFQSYGSAGANSLESPKSIRNNAVTADDDTVPLIPNISQQGSVIASSGGDCALSPLQYTFFVPGEGTCRLPFLGAGIKVTGDQNLKLYIRYGQKVEVEDDRIVADYVSETVSHDEGIDVFAWSKLPLQGGNYFVAVSDCGPENLNYDIYGFFYEIDLAGPVIFRAEVVGETLLVYGSYLDSGVELLLVNGEKQKHVARDEREPGCILVANKTGKRILPGETVTLRARFPSGVVTPKFKFTRPL